MGRMSEQATIGFRTHSGWAVAIVVAGSPIEPVILDRRRIEFADPVLQGSKQPFHAAEPLPYPEAADLIDRVRASAEQLAERALSGLIESLAARDYTIIGAMVLTAAGRPLPELAAILKSHALIHTAEGEFFREVIASACARHSLPITRVKEREVWDLGAEKFRIATPDLQRKIDALGKTLGPPWRQDEKLAAMAAWLVAAR